jgi:hypothetical protein
MDFIVHLEKSFYNRQLKFILEPMFLYYMYDVANPSLSLERMNLNTVSISFTIEYTFFKYFFTAIGYVYAHNSSNIDFFKFDRHLVMTKVGFKF